MKTLPNIYLIGKAGAGKTTVADHLKSSYHYQTSKFAHPVYMIAREYFGMKEKDRRLLQIIGTDAGRANISNDIWVNRLVEDLKIYKITCDIMGIRPRPFVSDDVRFVNEHEALQKAGWVGIYLEVSEEERIRRLRGRDGTAQEGTLGHASETGIDEFCNDADYILSVDSAETMEDLYARIDKLLAELVACDG
jgi:dephospho-CoA kinase